MRNTVLVDAGAIVAILSRGDHFHVQITGLLRGYEGRLLTTWPVIAEAYSMMPGDRPRRVLDWMGLGGIEVVRKNRALTPISPPRYLKSRASNG